MAYAVLLSLSQTIDDRILINHDEFEYPISEIGKQQIASLREQVKILQAFVKKFPEKAQSWETRITIAANEAEDILEHFMYEHIHWNLKVAKSSRAKDNHPYDFLDLKMAMDELNSIEREADVKSLIKAGKVSLGDATSTVTRSSSSTPPSVGGPTVGLENDLMKITDLLCQDAAELKVIPITGMGGIGKTTLAREAYHSHVIKKRFEVRAWITVSQDYKIDKIFEILLDELNEVDPDIYGSSNITHHDKIFKILFGRRYLIVIDDLWSSKAWDDIKTIFPPLKDGGRVMITTRQENVASRACSPSIPRHEMSFLNRDQSWLLLQQKACPNKECPPELMEIGKDIATRCGGLPLAIVLVGGILSTQEHSDPISWDKVAKNVRLAVDRESKGGFEERISLSYAYLSHHLRPCFLHMGGFPEDYEIYVSKLVKLWIAEGFVKPSKKQSMEEGAEIYLSELVQRSLAFVKTVKSNGKIKSCYVHDLVRDLCITKALDENYERRLSIAHPDLTRLARAYGSTLRSVISFQPNESSLCSLKKFRLLRLLDVVDTDAYSLPPQVFELFHLRYLAFDCPMEIPAAISRLRNLRTLIIRPSKSFMKYSNNEMYLPLEIWSLPLLTDLVSFFDLLPNPEGTDSAMEKLVTLALEKKLICTEEMMRRIPNLKKLRVAYFGNKYKEDYQLQNLALLQKLEKLTLVIKDNPTDQVMVKPVFPAKLQKLTLSGWRLSWDDMEAVGALTNLQVLKLKDHACEGDTWTTKEGQFLGLEFLLIDTSELEHWETKKSHFPKLKCLELYRCYSLEEIPESIGNILTLEMIKVHLANRSLVECVHGIQTEQQDEHEHQIQLDCAHYEAATTATSSSSSKAAATAKVGLENDLMKITDLLCQDADELIVIPITGMGGIGKTTLAMEAYNNDVIKKRFTDYRAWITVSLDYNMDTILANLLEKLKDVDPTIYGSSNITPHDKIYRILFGRKYLIVVDDLWSIKAWDDLRTIFPHGNYGSRIMITTRHESLASHVCPSIPHHVMSLLDPDQSWVLLKQNVFRSQ